MNKKPSRYVTPILMGMAVLVTFSGCGLIKDTTDNHLRAKELPPMVVPEEMDSEALGQLYPVLPSTDPVADEGFELPRPQPISANVFEETVKIQSFAGSSWILINQPPEEIWPRVRNILNRSGIPTQQIAASKGLIETVWIKFKNDDNTSHRFRFTIEPAIQVRSTEVKILQMQTPVGTEENVSSWPETSQDAGREREMLDIISNALAADISGPSVSLLAQSIGGVEKVELINPKVADPYLEIKLPFERAWASVDYSLERGGFTIDDKDQSAGTFNVTFKPESLGEDEEPGFFARLFSWGDDEVEGQQYLVVVKGSGVDVEVRIVDRDQHSLDKPLAARLLTIIRGNLS